MTVLTLAHSLTAPDTLLPKATELGTGKRRLLRRLRLCIENRQLRLQPIAFSFYHPSSLDMVHCNHLMTNRCKAIIHSADIHSKAKAAK